MVCLSLVVEGSRTTRSPVFRDGPIGGPCDVLRDLRCTTGSGGYWPGSRAFGARQDREKTRGPESKLREGDLVRFSSLTPENLPNMIGIFPTIEGAKQFARAFAEQEKNDRVVSFEGILFVGHNTPATVDLVQSFTTEGRDFELARVILTSGPLKGQKYWTGARRLRSAHEPDPARKSLVEGNIPSGPLLFDDTVGGETKKAGIPSLTQSTCPA